MLPEQLVDRVKVGILSPQHLKLIWIIANSLINMGHDNELVRFVGSLKLRLEPFKLSRTQILIIRYVFHIVHKCVEGKNVQVLINLCSEEGTLVEGLPDRL